MWTQLYPTNSSYMVSIHLHGEKGFYMLIFSIFLMPSHTNIHKLYWYPTGLLLIKLATSCCHMISLNPQHMRGILGPCGWSVWGVCPQTCICPCVHVWPRPFICSDTLWNARFSMPISITSTLPLIRQCRRCPWSPEAQWVTWQLLTLLPTKNTGQLPAQRPVLPRRLFL